MSIIYKHTNTINNKIYIGQTKNTISQRWFEHIKFSKNKKINFKFYKAIRKYGYNCWTHEIIAEYDDEIINEAEIYWVSYYDTFRNGYNSTTGGDNYILSEESKIKISESKKGKPSKKKGITLSEETKEKIRQSNLGKTHSEETKEKMRKSKSIEHCKHISEAQTGKKVSEETKEKISNALKGINHPLFGKHHSEETKNKMSKTRKGRISNRKGCIPWNKGLKGIKRLTDRE